MFAEESGFGYPAIQGARPRSGLDRVFAPNDTSGAIARMCGNRCPIRAVCSCLRTEPRKEPLQRIDRKPQRNGAFRRCRREQPCVDNVAEHAPGSALGQPRNAGCLAAIDPAADQGFPQQARGFGFQRVAALDMARQAQIASAPPRSWATTMAGLGSPS